MAEGSVNQVSAEDQAAYLIRGTAKIFSEKDLLTKLQLGRPLRVKLGVDPTAPDIHLGHTVALQKLADFQKFGHQAVLLIGDFTATIGDPSGRSATRPPLCREEVLENATTYTEQAFKILDRENTEVVYNGDWFRRMSYEEVLRLNSTVTLQQMLQREDFRKRLDKAQEVRLHELQYPVMQGWDSVEVRADVELGGTDQLFNILVGRDMQKLEGLEPQVAMLVPLLEGLDGVKKMSKSYDNYIGVNDAPSNMFGKIMSISDDLMDRYYLLLLGGERDLKMHPIESKKQLAERLIGRFHNAQVAHAARSDWEMRFSKKDLNSAELPLVAISALAEDLTLLSLVSDCFMNVFGMKKSNGELRKQFILPGSVQINGAKLINPDARIKPEIGDVLRLSKKQAIRFSE